MRYAIIIEHTDNNYSAYVPDLPGCVAAGLILAETEVAVHEVIACHIEGMHEDGLPIPGPSSQVKYIETAA